MRGHCDKNLRQQTIPTRMSAFYLGRFSAEEGREGGGEGGSEKTFELELHGFPSLEIDLWAEADGDIALLSRGLAL